MSSNFSQIRPLTTELAENPNENVVADLAASFLSDLPHTCK